MRSFFASGDAPLGAVLVLPGSGDGLDKDRVRQLADRGVTAMSVDWTAEPQPDRGPLQAAMVELTSYSPQVGLLGVSEGAEVAMLLAAEEPAVRAVAALSPPELDRLVLKRIRAQVIVGTDPAHVLDTLVRALAEPPSAEPPPQRPFPAPRAPR